MAAIAIDTNAYIEFCRGNKGVAYHIRRARQIVIPFIVIAELRAGFQVSSAGRDNEKVLARFLSSERVATIYPDDQTCHHFARLYAQLREAGTPIPSNDLWIAALVVQHDLTLLSRDRHFEAVRQIPRL